ncbi:wax ester/triacylglycerol synthase domain-containing protein [Streptomyces sp.]|uniref:wax ester/triacylglycerol synthase domain-containing protein n=1 Tax=Streptomyces sp. TaxID=1931 RepID=UPI002C84E2FA|nr:wax ester/triacylglycerol synthase domain-containing protein [Streptomyces sp.]HLL32522.1 wax ester/triacylglycerol synthase domain-containing protein [Streptomyces sp.]HZF86907.1 wax ester/triacylglycerol synthase domain-containing protein [Streptomyces sp.]
MHHDPTAHSDGLTAADLVLSAQDYDFLLIERPDFPGVIGVVHTYRGRADASAVRKTLSRLAPYLGRLGAVLRRAPQDAAEPYFEPVPFDPGAQVEEWATDEEWPGAVLAEITRRQLPADRPLMRVHVIQGPRSWWLVFSFHHVTIDGATMGRLLRTDPDRDPVPPEPAPLTAETALRVRRDALDATLPVRTDDSATAAEGFPAILPPHWRHRSLATVTLDDRWRRLRERTGATKGALAAWLSGAAIAGAVTAARGGCATLGLNVTVDLRRASPPPMGGNWTSTILCPWTPRAEPGENLAAIGARLSGADRTELARQALAYEHESRDVPYAVRREAAAGWGENSFIVTPDGQRADWHAMVTVLPRLPAWHEPDECTGHFVLPGAWLGAPWSLTWGVGEDSASVCALSSSPAEPAQALVDALLRAADNPPVLPSATPA